MNLEELKKKFIVDDDVLRARLQTIVSKALDHCQLDKHGHVLISNAKLSGRDKVKLTLAARAIAAQLDPKISPEVTGPEIGKYTGLPINQVRARAKEAVDDRFAESPQMGTYRAMPHKIEPFLDSISSPKDTTE
jgi:hypothetical protein